MNPIDYLLIAIFAIGALYTFYRLSLGYFSSRSLEGEAVDRNDVSSSPVADGSAPNSRGLKYRCNRVGAPETSRHQQRYRSTLNGRGLALSDGDRDRQVQAAHY